MLIVCGGRLEGCEVIVGAEVVKLTIFCVLGTLMTICSCV